jgi:uncharacterized DUF497 family protein
METMEDNRCMVDTNVLIYITVNPNPWYHVARQWLDRLFNEGFEVLEVFFNPEEPPCIRRSPRGGKRYLAQGRTEAGRYLIIAFERKNHEIIEIVTARDMHGRERQWYRKKGK